MLKSRIAHAIFAALGIWPLAANADVPKQSSTGNPVLDLVTTTTPEVRVNSVDMEVLRVRRIDVVDDNGVIRMTLAGNLPNAVIDGVEYQRSTPVGGIMFRDDKGNERGGVGYASALQGMVFALDHGTAEAIGFNVLKNGSTNLRLLSRPADVAAPSLGGALLPGGDQYSGVNLSMGKDGIPRVSLNDVKDRPRIRMTVTPEGYGAIEFLNAEGKVIHTLAPERDLP
jgi:hypothetical protein